MRGERFSEEQIIGVLKEAEGGLAVAELLRKHGITEGTFYRWKAKHGGMELSDAKRLSGTRRGEPGAQPDRWLTAASAVLSCEPRVRGLRLPFLSSHRRSGSLSTMNTLLQAGPNGRVPVPAEERLLTRRLTSARGTVSIPCVGSSAAKGMEPVLVLGQEGLYLCETTCACLATAGFRRVHALCGPGPTTLHRSNRLVSFARLPSPSLSDADLLEIVAALAARTGGGILLPVSTPDVRFASHMSGRLPPGLRVVPVPEPGLLETATDKLHFTRLTGEMGLGVPRTLAVEPGITAAADAAAVGFPMLAKPRHGEGGAGIVLIADPDALERFLSRCTPDGDFLLQEYVEGEDVAMTLLCERGDVFALALRMRWFSRNEVQVFQPIRDLEFLRSDWLEALGRRWVHETAFSGIADFDLRVDFPRRRACFLECDPRMMGTQRACATFGVNVPALLCRRALGERDTSAWTGEGHYLSLPSIVPWLRARGWRLPRRGPLRSGLRQALADPLPVLARNLGL